MSTFTSSVHVPVRGLLWRVAFATAAAVACIVLIGGIIGSQLANSALHRAVEKRTVVLAEMISARLVGIPSVHRGAFAQRMNGLDAIVTILGPTRVPVPGAPALPVLDDPVLHTSNRADCVSTTWRDQSYVVATRMLQHKGPIMQPVQHETIKQSARHEGARQAVRRGKETEVESENSQRSTPDDLVVVAVQVPSSGDQLDTLVLKLLGVLLAIGGLGVASALIVARDITTDVRAIALRALVMASGEAAALAPLPIRALDEVGKLVAAFNRLQRRFADELDAHRSALARLDDAERRKEVLITTLRHELRTPLNSIIGFAELLLSGVDGNLTDAQREDVEVVASSGRHLRHLVDDVLDLSTIASGRFQLNRQPVDLVPLVREVVREAEGQARKRKVWLRVEGVSSAIVQGDLTMLRRAITNLVQNAIEHAGGHVIVEIGLRGQQATVAVGDNGPGITPHDLKRLFKPFERGRSGDAARAGAGLGLAIALALFEVHGGTLVVESDVGKGSTFIATLPLQPTALVQAGFA